MGLRAGLDWCGKSRPTGIRSPDRPARSGTNSVFVQTLPNLRNFRYAVFNKEKKKSKNIFERRAGFFISRNEAQ